MVPDLTLFFPCLVIAANVSMRPVIGVFVNMLVHLQTGAKFVMFNAPGIVDNHPDRIINTCEVLEVVVSLVAIAVVYECYPPGLLVFESLRWPIIMAD